MTTASAKAKIDNLSKPMFWLGKGISMEFYLAFAYIAQGFSEQFGIIAQPIQYYLMMDCYVNDELSNLLKGEWFDKDAASALPVLSKLEREKLIERAESILAKDQLKEAEESLLKSFCQFYLGDITSYDLLFALFERSAKYEHRTNFWKERLKEVYPAVKGEELQPVLA